MMPWRCANNRRKRRVDRKIAAHLGDVIGALPPMRPLHYRPRTPGRGWIETGVPVLLGGLAAATLLGVVAVAVVIAFLFAAQPSLAQHNHAAGHNDYLGWSSGITANCCNDQDCGVINDDELRETSTGTEVRIAGTWCPVRPAHYITRGKSPDWNKPHACIRKTFTQTEPCERLLCFSGKGGV